MIKHKDPAVENVGHEIAGHLEEISKMFKPGVKITILVRHPEHPNGARDIVITDDTLEAVIDAISIRQKAEKLLAEA